MEIIKANKADADSISRLINVENNSQITPSYLINWYWEKPSGSSSVIILKDNEDVLGVSTSNNFDMNINGEVKRAAFPQKVVTSKSVRGQGYFSKLYRVNETDNYEQEGVDLNLTFTNHLSTPIFLKKFEYVKGISQDIILYLPRLTKKGCRIIEYDDFDAFGSEEFHFKEKNSILKSVDYFKWRYSKEKAMNSSGYDIIGIKKKDVLLGVAVLKKIKKKGVPVLALVDILEKEQGSIQEIISVCRSIVIKKKAFGLLVLDNAYTNSYKAHSKLKYVIKNQLNFLVKGKDEEQTKVLSNTAFNFWFGDLDFI